MNASAHPSSAHPSSSSFSTPGSPPLWYKIVSWLAVVWMLIGVLAWTMDLLTDEASLETLTDAQRQLYAARPGWIFAIYGLAIFSGLAGTIGLVMRRSWAVPLLAVSLLAVIVQFGYLFIVLEAIQLLGAAAALPFPLVIFAIGVGLLLLARQARRRGWLRD